MWQEIYKHMHDKEFYKYCDEYKKYYDKLKPETIEQCIANTIETKSHVAFAKYFIDHCKSSNALYKEAIIEYLDARLDIPKGKKMGKLRLYKPVAWNSLKVIDEEDKKYYSDVHVSNKILKGEAGEREVIIQLAICCRLTKKQLNRLLNLNGHCALYPLDLRDVLTAYELKKNETANTKGKEEKISYDEAQIILDQFYTKSHEELGKFAEYYKEYKTVPDLKDGIPVYREFLRVIADENKKEWNKNVEHEQYMNAVTEYYSGKFDRTDSIYDFVNTEYFPIFGFIRYRFMDTIREYLKKREKYEKNLYYCKCKLYSKYDERIMQPYNEMDLLVSIRGNTQEMSIVREILGYKDIISSKDFGINHMSSASVTPIKQLLDGRVVNKNSANEPGYNQGKPRARNEFTRYLPDAGSQNFLLRYAIATGNEDDIPIFMASAGYNFSGWDEELAIERTHALLDYAIRYRDFIINKWCEETNGLDKAGLRERFPFIKLLMYVNRDIETALITQYEDTGCCKDAEDVRKRVGEILKALIYPVNIYPLYDMNKNWYKLFGKKLMREIK